MNLYRTKEPPLNIMSHAELAAIPDVQHVALRLRFRAHIDGYPIGEYADFTRGMSGEEIAKTLAQLTGRIFERIHGKANDD